jgi:adiponectin receptor
MLTNLPEWYVVNPYVKSGYRKPTSLTNAILSIFEWHNETLNIYTHLIPGFIWLYMAVNCVNYDHYIKASSTVQNIIWFSYSTAACMGLTSSFAHLIHIIDHNWSTVAWKLDFMGVIMINFCHQVFDTYILFYKYPILLNTALCIESIFALFCIEDIIIKHTKKWLILYPLLSSTILTIPASFGSYISGNPILYNLSSYSVGCSCFIFIAGNFFIGKFPERLWNPNGIFDNFNSHVWHHVFIVLSIVTAFQGIPLLYQIS